MVDQITQVTYKKLPILLLVLVFFGPYFPGTPLRLDQIVGWTYILGLLLAFVVYERLCVSSQHDKYIVFIPLIILLFALIRLFIDVENYRAAFQISNQFSYFCVGVAIFFFNHDRLIKGRQFFVLSLIYVSVVINLFAFLQFIDPYNEIVLTGLKWYGGTGDNSYAYEDFSTISALTLLGGGQAVSIFSGVQGLAIFDLFIIAIAYGALYDKQFIGRMRVAALFSLLFALIGGALSGSKTFFFGLLILFSIVGSASMTTSEKPLRHFLIFTFSVLAFVVIYKLASSELRVTRDVWNLFLEFRFLGLFESRFGFLGGEGYLSDVMAKTFEPTTLLWGLGSFAVDYKYTDFEFRQVVLVGGIPLFVIYYGFLIYLLVLNWRSQRETSYGIPLFALGIAFLGSGIGMDTHLQARTMPLWVIANLLLAVPAGVMTRITNASPYTGVRFRC